jgi:hypothetical protein
MKKKAKRIKSFVDMVKKLATPDGRRVPTLKTKRPK